MLRFLVSRRRLITLFALAPIAAGCGRQSGPQSADSGKVPGVFRYALTAEPTTLDPALVSDGPTIDLLMHLYEGLVGWNEKNEVVPLVAADLPEVSPDGRTYTFTIRDGVTFTSGRAVTAEDIKYSLTRALDPKLASPVAMTYLNDIVGARAVADGRATDLAGVKVINPKTLQITIDRPRAYFLGKLTYPTGYVLAREAVEKGPTTEQGAKTIDEKNSVGTGPFTLATYTRQSLVTLAANPGYWNGRPKLSRIERPIVLDNQTRRNLYETGKLDLVELTKGDYERDRNDPALKDQIKLFDRASVYYLGMNQTHYAPFKDRRVRRAIAHAINKDDIIQNVLLGVTARAEGIVPAGIPGYDPALKGIPFDPETAQRLLAEAGYPGGKGLPPLALAFREQQPDLSKTAEKVQQQLAAVGVAIQLKPTEWTAFLKATDDRRVDFFHMRWAADYLDPQNFLSVLLHSKAPENRTAYKNAQYDALLEQADAAADPNQRIRLYRQAERIVVEDAAWVPLYFQRDIELIKPYVRNLRDSLMGHLPHTTTTVE